MVSVSSNKNKYLRFFAGSWTYIHLLFFQIHEKLHYYEKQNPVPILHGAAALADDVSVPFWDHRGRSSTGQQGLSRTYPSADRGARYYEWKPEEVANVSKSPVITEFTLILCWFSLSCYKNFACRYPLVLPWQLRNRNFSLILWGREKLSAIRARRKSQTRGMLWRNKDKWDSSIADSTKKMTGTSIGMRHIKYIKRQDCF